MKLSCLPVSFFSELVSGRMSIIDWAKMARELGLDAIDLSILFLPDRSPRSAKTIRQELKAINMEVAMLTTYPDFTHPDSTRRQEELALEKEAVALAAELGAKLVRVTAGQAHPETTREEGIEWAVEGLTELVGATRDQKVTLVYENHAKPSAWTYMDFSQPPEIFLEIVRATSDSGLGVNFDTGNAAAFTDDPIIFLNEIIQRVVSVHASDTALHGELKHVALGSGITPFQALYKRLKKYGWDGWICIEEASMQGKAGVENAAKFTRKTWAMV